MSDAVKRMAWDAYAAAMRRWRLDNQPDSHKPRAALQIGSHIESLPVEANAEGSNLPVARSAVQ